MADGPEQARNPLSHLLVQNHASDQEFRRPGGGNPQIRPVEDRAAHGRGLIDELQSTFESGDEVRNSITTDEELRALGTIVTLEGQDPAYPLKVDSLQQLTRHRTSPRQPKWLLLSVLPTNSEAGLPERATVWVSDAYRAEFLQLFEKYLQRDTPTGKPQNNELVANIARIRSTVLRDLWQSDGEPESALAWWEVWLHRTSDGPDLLRHFAESMNVRVAPQTLRLTDRDVMWVEATWVQLEVLPFTAVPLAEIRRPEFIDSIEDLPVEEQSEYVDDLAGRLESAAENQPAVCHLDTGVARTHILLEGSLAPDDLHTVIGVSGFDQDGHGTTMAGIALFGDELDHHLVGSHHISLRHRLESVRILPNRGEPRHHPRTYGDVTGQAVSLPEATSRRRRVFCLPITTNSDSPGMPGQPTLWSATLDALAVGTAVVRTGDELQLLTPPDPAAARLIMVSAGNVDRYVAAHLDESDTSSVRDPGQAWNVLTVGAHTEMTDPPSDPAYGGWTALAASGELSPHSRTSLPFGPRPWPVKPDIVLEGGNVLHDGGSLFEPKHAALSLRSTGHANDQALASAIATSAATAQASRLAALAMATYPTYWPETIRALLVHAAQWTPAMRNALDSARARGLQAQQMLLRRYGWGVPTEDRVLYSSGQAVTLVVQDEFVPFSGDTFASPAFRLHDLPWPRESLRDLGAAPVTLRVTLSYFIEPTASRRGWRQRYAYPSHSLRFELQDPLESERHFIQRVNRDASTEESGGRPTSSQVKWTVGANQRNLGSLHQDEWETSGIELAQSGKLAVYPVGGWWKYRRQPDRVDTPVRYTLIVSLRTAETDIDLYTPIATLLNVPTTIPIE
ncbi:subtilisin family serine protease [Mycolicibacter kumamotonensis]|uniref:Subtilisin family serine protease n=1 Tax=Mycolicibacter kumamotonensis TaxID=354243 RepID=A0A1B8S9M3_9MYCO|nr:subtilisin family serine protease [Mycolicibacter kumamotonensis]